MSFQLVSSVSFRGVFSVGDSQFLGRMPHMIMRGTVGIATDDIVIDHAQGF